MAPTRFGRDSCLSGKSETPSQSGFHMCGAKGIRTPDLFHAIGILNWRLTRGNSLSLGETPHHPPSLTISRNRFPSADVPPMFRRNDHETADDAVIERASMAAYGSC